MDNTRLIDLAMKAFALGLCEGHELADQQLGVRVRTGRSLMQKLLPTTSNTLPREISNATQARLRGRLSSRTMAEI